VGSVFVTGGTGYLGSNLVARLLKEGEELILLARNPPDRGFPHSSVRVVHGDVQDPESLRRAMAGCDRVFHAAAHVRMWDADPTRFETINVGGLKNILRAAADAGVARIVYTSSFIALGPTDGSVGDEDWEPPGRTYYNEYERTKAAADRLARQEARQGAPLIILYPGVVYGPGPLTAGNLVGKTVSDFLSRSLPGLLGKGDRRFCYALASDVVEGHLRAMRHGKDGDRFILGGENRTMQELFAWLEKLTSVPGPRRRVPYAVAELVGRVQRWRARLTGIQPEITDEVVRIYRHEWAYSSQRAEQALGYTVTPFARGLEETVNFLRQGKS
jgi:NAD+-dependent farnesol dehydrogenase